jgi:hypothetical protein
LLRCGYDGGCEGGVVASVHVISYAVSSAPTAAALTAIAVSGGTREAAFVRTGEALRDALSQVIEDILHGE